VTGPVGHRRLSYSVKVWGIDRYRGKRRTTHRVRWAVEGRRFTKSFGTKKLAESFRSKLVTAAREGVAFDVGTGLPEAMVQSQVAVSWYEHACNFVNMKWAHASPRHRKSIADALATVTPTLLTTERGAPDDALLRHALYAWSFNAGKREQDPPPDVARAVQWAAEHTVPLSELNSAVVVRQLLDALAVRLDQRPAAPTTVARKRAVLSGVLRYAVELELLASNPLDRVQWRPPKSAEAVDRRVVVNPEQARALLAAVGELAPALEAFFGCLYYAALRPAEALHLRSTDLALPDSGWGELTLTGSTQEVGHTWGDSGARTEDRGLKHRPARDSRVVPACPDLVQLLTKHLDEFGPGLGGRLFVTRTGRFGRPVSAPYSNPVSTNTYTRAWRRARESALTPAQVDSPLGARPYDLRHACVSLWLNAGVPATQVAEWAGHSVHVLMRVYAKCVHGQEEAARRRIEAALGGGTGL
jgi:integrase